MKANLYTTFLALSFLTVTSCRVTKKEYSLNKDVKQTALVESKDSVTVKAGELYQAGKVKRFFLGDHYRDTWTTPVEVPVIDLDTALKGLEILKKGGGMQTYSLKLKAANGRLYSLRSIQKDPSPTLPKPLQYSFADDIVQDQISASHPYGAFTLPPLGDAVGIYHTNPQLFYIPDSPTLGKYREDFGGVLAMLEEDADEDWSGYEDFGGTENAVSSESVMEDLLADNKNKIDEKNLLRARLFDMWIGDWDRHEGQWRWAELEGEDGKLYRPIPEDRDNMLFRFDGFIMWFANRKWSMRKFQDFDNAEVRDIIGLNFNARHFDRRFLASLTKEEWIGIAEELQEALTDELIEEAIRLMPKQAFEVKGEYIVSKLKERRPYITSYAERYYKVLARQVDILGSDKNELVEITREDSGTTVEMYDASDDGKKKDLLYSRTFDSGETKEIRIYLFGDEDFVKVEGEAKNSPVIRIIGGEEEDKIEDVSTVKGWRHKTVVYDNIEGNEIEAGKETKLELDNTLDVNAYDFKGFTYNYLGPAVFVGYNSDDGVYIGGGVVIKTNGFRKSPYATYQKIVANVAPSNFSWNFRYLGDFVQVIGNYGFNVEANVRAPNFFTNFYGFGNETETTRDANDDFYKVRYSEVAIFPGITFPVKGESTIKLGPVYRYYDVENENDKFINTGVEGISDEVFEGQHYGGAALEADIKTIGNSIAPEKGIRWWTSLQWLTELGTDDNKLSKIASSLSGYYSIEEPTLITFATRIGVASIAGDFRFYQANTLGSNAGLMRPGTIRGYARDRFSGRTSLYQNNEVRVRLARIPFYYLPFAIGVLAHYDQGRVWYDNNDSSEWHSSYGGGIWFNPLGKWVFTTTYSEANGGDSHFLLSLGFFF